MATIKADRDLSEVVFHSKYGYMAGWDEARDMVWAAMEANKKDERVRKLLDQLWDSMGTAERNARRDAYTDRIDG